jgi:hypothetical protein
LDHLRPQGLRQSVPESIGWGWWRHKRQSGPLAAFD